MNAIQNVITQRINLQTNQRKLWEKYKITNSLFAIMNPLFLKDFDSWDADRRKDFIFIIGGHVNFKKTESFINSLPR